jgi:hypothetical protein
MAFSANPAARSNFTFRQTAAGFLGAPGLSFCGRLIHLNDELIYQRPSEPNAASTFGLYRASSASEANIRSVIMTGDWPSTLPEDFLHDPLTAATETP